MVTDHAFAVGQRVIVKASVDPEWFRSPMNLVGYFGHVSKVVYKNKKRPMVLVSFKGRVGAPAEAHNLDPYGDDPYPMYEDELEHAD